MNFKNVLGLLLFIIFLNISFAITLIWENTYQNSNCYYTLFWVDNYMIESCVWEDEKFNIKKWTTLLWYTYWTLHRKYVVSIFSGNNLLVWCWMETGNTTNVLRCITFISDRIFRVFDTENGFKICIDENNKVKIGSITDDSEFYFIDDWSATTKEEDDICISNVWNTRYIFYRNWEKLIKFWYNIIVATQAEWIHAYGSFDNNLSDFWGHFWKNDDWQWIFSTQIWSYNIDTNTIEDNFQYWDKNIDITNLEIENWFDNDIYWFENYNDNQIIWEQLSWNWQKVIERYYLLSTEDFNNGWGWNWGWGWGWNWGWGWVGNQDCIIDTFGADVNWYSVWLFFWWLNVFQNVKFVIDAWWNVRTKQINWIEDNFRITSFDFYTQYLHKYMGEIYDVHLDWTQKRFWLVWNVYTKDWYYKYFWDAKYCESWFNYEWKIGRKWPIYTDEEKEVKVWLACSWNTIYWRDIENNHPLCVFEGIEDWWYWKDTFEWEWISWEVVFWYFNNENCWSWVIRFFDAVFFVENQTIYSGITEIVNWRFSCDRDGDGKIGIIEASICSFTIGYHLLTDSFKFVDNFKQLISNLSILTQTCKYTKINFLTGWTWSWYNLVEALSNSSNILEENDFIKWLKTAIYVLLFIIITILVWLV